MTLLWLNVSKNLGDMDILNAIQRAERAISLAEKLSRERPDEWIYTAAEVEAHLFMSNILGISERPEESHASARRALELGSRLAEKYPDCISFRMNCDIEGPIRRGTILDGPSGWPV